MMCSIYGARNSAARCGNSRRSHCRRTAAESARKLRLSCVWLTTSALSRLYVAGMMFGAGTHVDHGRHAGRQRFIDAVPQPLRLIDPLTQQIAGADRRVAVRSA